ncbi:MAG: DNA gyrase subunit A [Anaerolineaceae bacterium]|nr:DNA gyrase subunit A [Anaerolineaceae bacterium]
MADSGEIRAININEEMRGSYLDYAMSVIVARALPDARDGLKPVHRRILYAMHDMGLRHNTQYKKSARVVGDVLGKYHPHGDGAVYDAMARMVQVFSLRYPLLDGQGNFGSVDGDSPAAMRYTEARLARIASELLVDIDMDTVDFDENYDGSAEEPRVLPARLPNLLLNGASGIAVGMATNVPPHNLRELTDAIVHIIDNYSRRNQITVDELMAFVQGPDFPTGALVIADEGLREAYTTGRGRVVVRARYEMEEHDERHRIILSEIPYQVSKSAIVERIVALVREGRIDTIADLRDESDRNGMRLTVELKRNAQPLRVLNQLYKFTQLQSTFSIQMLALDGMQPRSLGLKQALQIYIDHRLEVIERRSRHELKKLRARAHILEGLLKALSQIEAVIRCIRASADTDVARAELIKRFGLDELQANAILEMQLRRLAALEQQKLQGEYDEVLARSAWLVELLASQERMLALIREDMVDLAESYGDPRRTEILHGVSTEFDEADLVREERVLVSLTTMGYIKRVPTATYRAQHRGGKGLIGMTTREEDALTHIITAGSHDQLLFFSDRGKVYSEPAWRIPEATRTGRGITIHAVLPLDNGERITTILPHDAETGAVSGHLILATRNGRIKRVPLQELLHARSSGLIAIHLDDDDTLVQARPCDGDQEVMVVTDAGQSIRFHESAVRVMGRSAAGVHSIRLRPGDRVAAMDVIDEADTHQLVVTRYGYGKRTPLDQYRQQDRYGFGIRTLAQNPRTGPVVAMRCLRSSDDILLMSSGGIIIRTSLDEIRETGRSTQGVKVMDLDGNSQVVGLAVVDLQEEAAASLNGNIQDNGHA